MRKNFLIKRLRNIHYETVDKQINIDRKHTLQVSFLVPPAQSILEVTGR